jgi:hypothetical protein
MSLSMIQKLDAAASPFLIFKSSNYVGDIMQAPNNNFRGTSDKIQIFDNKLCFHLPLNRRSKGHLYEVPLGAAPTQRWSTTSWPIPRNPIVLFQLAGTYQSVRWWSKTYSRWFWDCPDARMSWFRFWEGSGKSGLHVLPHNEKPSEQGPTWDRWRIQAMLEVLSTLLKVASDYVNTALETSGTSRQMRYGMRIWRWI